MRPPVFRRDWGCPGSSKRKAVRNCQRCSRHHQTKGASVPGPSQAIRGTRPTCETPLLRDRSRQWASAVTGCLVSVPLAHAQSRLTQGTPNWAFVPMQALWASSTEAEKQGWPPTRDRALALELLSAVQVGRSPLTETRHVVSEHPP